MSSAIRTENLSKHFLQARALSNLNLEVPEGAIYALVGPNGAGKTTAIKVMMNILGPSAGRAEVLGMDSKKLAGRHFAHIGYVSENQQMPEWMRVDYFLRYLQDFYPTWDSELEAELVRNFDLPLDRKLRHLSRGMKMKAALAGSLAYRPRLIVMDEPFTGLDPLVRDQLIESLLERATEATVLISSHDLGEIESFASHVGYLDQGRHGPIVIGPGVHPAAHRSRRPILNSPDRCAIPRKTRSSPSAACTNTPMNISAERSPSRKWYRTSTHPTRGRSC